MRANKIEAYRSVLQVIDMPGCPVCRFMKNHQSVLVQQKTDLTIRYLCNFHMWAVAATQRTLTAAELFQSLLRTQGDVKNLRDCDICNALRAEEDRRIKEFSEHADTPRLVRWLRTSSTLCLLHGAEFERLVSPATAAHTAARMHDYRDQLSRQLSTLGANDDPDSAKWGVLGHVAEFLVSQRGLRF